MPERSCLAGAGLSLALVLGSISGLAEPDTVGFREHVVPILNAHCVACHLTGLEQGGIALHARAAHGNLVGVRSEQSGLNRVEPGDRQASYLYHKVANTHHEVGGEGEPMPMGGGLDPELVEVIARWIDAGAPAE
ncbi:MAG: hypothetical protein JJT88_01480 [Gammaproteobacteria bacterium]|nr:hypothetical protein [Gammaproteobacteria bacterium]